MSNYRRGYKYSNYHRAYISGLPSSYNKARIVTLAPGLDSTTYYSKRKKYSKRRRPFNIIEPITSYGILLFSFQKDNTPVFLLYQRRDNFEYMDFMRGCWSSERQLFTLFSLMSHEERQRIREYTFQELWDDLWVEHNCRIYRDGFAKAKKKYDSIHSRIPQILDTTTSCTREPPWGWPKGKKNGYHEAPLACALREFKEETRLDARSINVISRAPYTENFKGSNGKEYITHYYLCEMLYPQEVLRMKTPQCIRETTISEEASEVQWFTYEEACAHLNPRRQAILRSTLGIIEERKRKNNPIK